MGSTIMHVVIAAGLGAIQWGVVAALLIRKRSRKREPAIQ
jgi:hypothetical protein